MSNYMHAFKQLTHTHTHTNSHTLTHLTPLQTGAFTPMHPCRCRAAARHPASIAPVQVTMGMATAVGTASLMTHTCHCPRVDAGRHTITQGLPSASLLHCPPQPCALTLLGGTPLKEPGATWLPLELRKHPTHSTRSPKLGGLGPSWRGEGCPELKVLGPKSCLQALGGSCKTCPSQRGDSGLLSPASPWLQAQAQPADLFLWGRKGKVASFSSALGAGGQRGLHRRPALCVAEPRQRCTELENPISPFPDGKLKPWEGRKPAQGHTASWRHSAACIQAPLSF